MICAPHKTLFEQSNHKNEVSWACSISGERRGAYRVLVGKPGGKRPLARLEHRWENNIKIDLQEVGWRNMDWIDLAQDGDKWQELANVVMTLQVA